MGQVLLLVRQVTGAKNQQDEQKPKEVVHPRAAEAHKGVGNLLSNTNRQIDFTHPYAFAGTLTVAEVVTLKHANGTVAEQNEAGSISQERARDFERYANRQA